MSAILTRRHSDFPLQVKEAPDRRHSFAAPPRCLEQVNETDSISIKSNTLPHATRRISSTVKRRSQRVSQAIVAAVNKRKARYASTTPSHWELKLIEGLLGDDNDNDDGFDFGFSKRQSTFDSVRSNGSSAQHDPATGSTIAASQETVPEKSTKKLHVHRISLRPSLRILNAVQADEDINDNFSMTDSEHGAAVDDIETASCSSIITFSPVPQLQLDADNWSPRSTKFPEFSPVSPLQSEHPYAFESLPDDSHFSSASSSVSSLASTHPNPLRSHPPEKVIHKVESQASLRSVASNKSNRVGFVMQKNDSSVSLHSQGTLTDLDNTGPLADNHEHPIGKLLNLSRSSITTYESVPRPYLRRPRPLAGRPSIRRRLSIASAILSPVTEIAERKNSRRNSDTLSEDKQPSTLRTFFKHEPRRFGGLKFSGAIVSQSRRSARLQHP